MEEDDEFCDGCKYLKFESDTNSMVCTNINSSVFNGGCPNKVVEE